MASSRRLERLQSVIERETAQIIRLAINDPRIGPVVITHVKLSRDLRYCTIYVNPRGSESEQRTTLRGLQSAHQRVQGKLGEVLRLRYTPLVRFEIDKGIEKAQEMDRLFRQIQNQKENQIEDSCQVDIKKDSLMSD